MTLTLVYSPRHMNEDNATEIICHTRDDCVNVQQQWSEELLCYASWALTAAGKLQLTEVRQFTCNQ